MVRRTGQVWHQKVHFEVRKQYTCDALLSALASGILLHFAATLSSMSEHKKYITRPPHIDHIITSHIRHNQLLSCFTCSIAVAFLERERKQNYFSQGGVSLFIKLETHQTSKPLKDHESDTSGLTLPTHSYSSIAFHAKMSHNLILIAMYDRSICNALNKFAISMRKMFRHTCAAPRISRPTCRRRSFRHCYRYCEQRATNMQRK